MTFRKYEKYTLVDFLEDDFFIQWIIKGDARDNAFWQAFVKQHPEQKDIVIEAASTIRAYRRQKTFDNETNREALWGRIHASIAAKESTTRTFPIHSFTRIAASILLLIVCSFGVWKLTRSDFNIVSTAYGEMKAVTLPDESIVMLNGNSLLKYRDTWDKNAAREVWVEGEAYFDVKHLNQQGSDPAPYDRFIVHGNDLDISVLGTSFNVKSRRDRTNIALITGKIQVSYVDSDSLTPSGLVMFPGDYAEYEGKKLRSLKKLHRPHRAATWTVGEIAFADVSLNDIMESLQDNYGYTIQVEDEGLMKLRIEGEISVTNIQELLALISSTLGIRVEESGKKIIVARKQT